MGSSAFHNITPIICTYILLVSTVFSISDFKEFQLENQTFKTKKKFFDDSLAKINKPYVKLIKSADGDIIDCVLFHLQPAFDLAELKGKITLDPPDIPKGNMNDDYDGMESEAKQLWNLNGESCPEGTIPIRRTTKGDLAFSNFGKNVARRSKRANSVDTGRHEHAVASSTFDEVYGGKAVINVWSPYVSNRREFSLSQIWIVSNDTHPDANTLEAGWQVFPELYKDNRPRFFIFSSNNGYKSGCYNLLCSGFIQTSHKFVLGGALNPVSTYNGEQFVITVLIWKDPKSENWWLKVGSEIVGYWPSHLFPQLQDHATLLEFGGEVYNTQPLAPHTTTQMGSGHFPYQGLKKAAFMKNLEEVDLENNLNPIQNVKVLAEKPNCYDAILRFNKPWGQHIYFGGPGKNGRCP